MLRSQFKGAGDEILPELHVYGAYTPEKYMKLNDLKNGFIMKGWCEDAIATLSQYRLNLAPLRFGAGIKGKIADSWYAGTPTITTKIGAEGMHDSLPFGGIVCSTIEEIATNAFLLYQNNSQWEAHQKEGFQIIKNQFDSQKNSKKFLTLLTESFSKIAPLRANNFTGSLLWYHQFRSTEYFSRWIESKNSPR